MKLSSLIVSISFFALTVAQADAFTLTSPDISSGALLHDSQVYEGFGCSGANTSPALLWKDPPAGTKSYAVTVYDPDAPTGSGWWHWIVYNISADVSKLAAGAGDQGGKLLPVPAVQGRNDYGTHDFGGACPPKGDAPHRYIFTVHALQVDTIDVPYDASAALIGYMINANSLGRASITAHYGR